MRMARHPSSVAVTSTSARANCNHANKGEGRGRKKAQQQGDVVVEEMMEEMAEAIMGG